MRKCKRITKLLILFLAFALVLGLMPTMPLHAEVAEYEACGYYNPLPPLYESDEPTGDKPTGEEPNDDEVPTDEELIYEESYFEDDDGDYYGDYEYCHTDYDYEEAYYEYAELHMFAPFFTGPFMVISPQPFQKVTEVLLIEVAANAIELAGEVSSVVAVIEGVTYPLTFDPVSYMATASLNFFELGIANMQVVDVNIVLTTTGGAIHEETILVPYIFEGAVLSYLSSDPAVAQTQVDNFFINPDDACWEAAIGGISLAHHPINSVLTPLVQVDFEVTHPFSSWQQIKPHLDLTGYDLSGVVQLTFDVYIPYYSTTGGTTNAATNLQNSTWQLGGQISVGGSDFWNMLDMGALALNHSAFTSVTGPDIVIRDNSAEAARTTWRRRLITLDVSHINMSDAVFVNFGLVIRAPYSGPQRPTFSMPVFIGNIQFHSEPNVPRNQIFDYFETYIGHSGWFNHLNPTVNATAVLGRAYARFGDYGLRLSVDGPGAGSVTLNSRSSFYNTPLNWSHATNDTNLFFWVQPHDAGPWLDVDIVSNGVQYNARVNWDDVIANAWHVNGWYRVNIPFASFVSMGSQNLGTAANRSSISHIRFTIQSGSMYLDHIYAHRNVPDPVNDKTPLDISSFIDRGGAPVDQNITVEAASLFQYLRNVMFDPDAVLFGHQQTTQDGLSFTVFGDHRQSDIKLGVNDFPAIFGYDSLFFDWGLEDSIENAIIAAHEFGAIITLASHIPNPMAPGLAYNNMTNAFGSNGLFVQDGVLISGTDAYDRLVEHMERVYIFCRALQDEGIPIIYRPWHEIIITGSPFFWWHLATPEEYRALWQWTYYFLTDRGIHNVLWAYSPNTASVANIALLYTEGENSFYPGDAYVDIFGYDTYTATFGPLVGVLNFLAQEAIERNKILALTETGPHFAGISPVPNYFMDMLNAVMGGAYSHHVAYILTWANYGPDNFFIPWPEFDNEPEHPHHEYFVRFYNDPRTIFASQTGGFEAITGLRLSAVTDVSIQEDDATIDVGETKILTIIFSPVDAKGVNVTWTSNYPDIATVSATGVVTAVAPGVARITVTTDCGYYTDTIYITVDYIPEPPCCTDYPYCTCTDEPCCADYPYCTCADEPCCADYPYCICDDEPCCADYPYCTCADEPCCADYPYCDCGETTTPQPPTPPTPPQLPEQPPLPPGTTLPPPSAPLIPWAPRPIAEQPATDDAPVQYQAYDDVQDDVLYEEYEQDDEVEDAPPLPSLNRLIFTVGNVQYLLNDHARTSVGAPFIDPATDRMMIPLRTLAEAIGAQVEWSSETRSAIIDLPTGVLILPVDEALPDGMGIPMLVSDRAFIPLRFVMYAFNKTVEWDSANRAAVISW